MKPFLKWTLWPLCALLVALASLVAITPLAVNSRTVQQWALRRVNAVISGKLSVDRLQVSLAAGKIHARGVEVAGEDGVPIVRAARLEAAVSWRRLLHGVLQLEPVLLDDVRADIEIRPDGAVNIARAFQSPYPSPPSADGTDLSVVLRGLRLTRGQATVRLPDIGMVVSAQGLSLAGEADFSTYSARLDLSAQTLHYRGQGIDRELSGLSLAASLAGAELDVRRLEFRSGDSRLSVSGGLDDLYRAPRFALHAQLETRLADIGEMLWSDLRGRGPVTASLDFSGALDNPRVDLQARYGGGRLWGRPVAAGDLRLKLQDLKLVMAAWLQDAAGGRVDFEADADLGPAFGHGRLSAAPDLARLAYRCSLRSTNIDLTGLLPQLPDLGGRLTAVVKGQGSGLLLPAMQGRLEVQARLAQVKQKRLTAPVDARLALRVQMQDNRLTVSGLRLRVGGTRLSGGGQWDLARDAGRAALDVTAADLGRDLALLGIRDVAGRLTGRLRASGSLADPRLDVTLQGGGLSAAGVRIGDVDLAGRVNGDGMLRIRRLRIANRASRITADGRLPLRDFLAGGPVHADLRFAARLESVSPRDFMPDFPLSGRFNGRLTADGRLPHLRARASLTGRGLESAGVRGGDLGLDLRLVGPALLVDRLRLDNGPSHIEAAGHVRLLRDERFSLAPDPAFVLRVDAPEVEIGDFIDSLGGRLSLTAALEGTLRRPVGNLQLEASDLRTGAQRIAALRLRAHLGDDVLKLQDFVLSLAPGAQLAGQGQISRGGAYALQLAGAGMPLDAIDWVRRQKNIRGRLDLTLSGEGTLDHPRLEADVRVSALRVNARPLEDVTLKAALRDTDLRLEGHPGFDLQARCDLKSRDFDAAAVFDQTDLKPYLRLADLKGWTGRLDGRVSARGRLGALAAASAMVSMDYIELSQQGRQMVAGRDIAVHLERGRIGVDRLRLDLLQGGRLDVSGQAALEGPLAIHLSGDVPVKALQIFAPELGNPSGRLALAADIGGRFRNPAVNGRLDFVNIAFIVPGLDQRLHDLNGHVLLRPRRIDLEKITARLEEGSLNLSGRLDIRGLDLETASLKLVARQVALSPMEDVEAVLNADLTLEGNLQKSLLAGRVALVEGYYERDVDLSLVKIAGQEITSLGRRKRAYQAPRKITADIDLPPLRNMQLDVAFITRRPFEVDNDMAYMEISADLQLRGTPVRPVVSGRASVDSGTITFQGRVFEVTKGVIDFVNPERIEPHLDITGEGKIGDYRVFLTLQGSVDELDLKLRSDPTLPDADILSLILLGHTTRQAGKGFSGESVAAGLISSGLGSKVKKKAGLDILQAETQPVDENSGDSTAPVRITVGKNLNRRLSVKYQFTTGGDENVQRTVAEYKLLEDLSAIGYQESTGVYGGMLKYKLEFR